MTHAREGTLQSYLDGELSVQERQSVGAHTEACTSCASELESLRHAADVFHTSIASVDVAVPAAEPVRTEILRRHWSGRTETVRRTVAWAAGLVVLLGAAAAVAMPGSPVREWVQELFGPSEGTEVIAEPPAGVVESPPVATSGVAVLPVAGRVRIAIERPATTARLHVRFVDGTAAAVQAAGATSARFTTAPGEIRVADPSGGVLIVEVPRAAEDISIRVADRVLVSGSGRAYRLSETPAEQSTDELVFEIGG